MDVLEIAPDRTAPKGTVAFHGWRGQALSHASARRELWRECTLMSNERLAHEIKIKGYQTTDTHCIAVRGRGDGKPWDVDLHYLRMYLNEQRHRTPRRAWFRVLVSFPDGLTHEDEMSGSSRMNALNRAARNWPSAVSVELV